VRATSTDNSETVFLIEQNYSPIGMVGIDRSEQARRNSAMARRRALEPGLAPKPPAR